MGLLLKVWLWSRGRDRSRCRDGGLRMDR